MTPPAASARLLEIRGELLGPSITLGRLADRLGHVATAMLLLICGLAAFVPGVAVVLGLPLCLIALGLMLGRDRAWLPAGMRRRRIPGQPLSAAIERLAPRLHWIERRIRPRATWATGPAGRRAIGLAAFVCGVLIVLPVPFGNTAPAIAVILMGLGLLAGDGLAVLAGLAAAALALVVDLLLLAAGWAALVHLSTWIA
ncbi:MAG: hypothetical protein BGO51_27875 [Rhodospirillales bacterium 69-11]|nr:exopolysaccharide biosynthesis protein [Rhodospirillales bacterium]OJW25145.1 MAG: hypothetical protein BGO51_27875 [Rhodospirillales bacterium 69-11]